MKKLKFNNMPAGTVVLYKKHSIWKRLWYWIKKKELPYNGVLIDPFGDSEFIFKNGLIDKYNVTAFIPKKKYSNRECNKLLTCINLFEENVKDVVLGINVVRPNTLTGETLEEMFEGNKYYTKEIKG